MKPNQLLLFLVALVNSASGQWNNPAGIEWTNDDVGINTTTPAYPLHVIENNNNVSAAGYFENTSQTTAGGIYSGVTGDANATNSNMDLIGVEGIGNNTSQTTTQSYGFKGKGTNSEKNYGGYFEASGGTSAAGINVGAYGIITSNGAGVINTGIYGDANGLTGTTTFAGYFRGDLLCTRNAGIGVGSPGFKLDVSTSATGDGIRMTQSGSDDATLFLNQASNNNWSLRSSSSGHFLINNGATNRFYIDGSSNGRVGIGTNSPSFKLDVLTTAASDGLRVRTTVTSGSAVMHLFANNTGGSDWVFNSYGNGSASPGSFEINGPGTGNLFIDGSNGFTGIGTSAPTAKLQVEENSSAANAGIFNLTTNSGGSPIALTGNAVVSGASTNAKGVYGKADGGSTDNFGVYGETGTSAGTNINAGVFGKLNSSGGTTDAGVYGDDGGTGGYAGYFSGDIYVTGTPYSTSGGPFTASDFRLKKNIKPYIGASEKIAQINIYNYKFKTEEFANMKSSRRKSDWGHRTRIERNFSGNC